MRIIFLVSVFLLLAVSSCTLDYRATTKGAEDRIPELTFSEANFTRYENKNQTMNFSAAKIEQYADGTKLFAKDIEFTIFNANNEIETSGRCGLLATDETSGTYEFYDEIQIVNTPREITLKSNALRWNKNTEQITGSISDAVSILKNDTTISGKGFSASAVSNTFSFSEGIYGNVIGEDDEETD